MTTHATKPQLGISSQRSVPEVIASGSIGREQTIGRLRLLWEERRTLVGSAVIGVFLGAVVAFLIPNRYQSTVQLMPPDSPSTSTMLRAALAAGTGGGQMGSMAGDLLGIRDSGGLFIGVLNSRTVQDRLVARFELTEVYRVQLKEDARKELATNSAIADDPRRGGIITITVTDKKPERAAAIAQGYVDELNRLVAEVSTSAAHRERVFLEERIKNVKQDLDQSARDFSQFASSKGAIDMKEQGRVMVEAAATLEGQLMAAESELKGLEQIYTGNNVRVRSLQARIDGLRGQLGTLSGKAGTTLPETETSDNNDLMYPSIRQMPILGVTYTDLYRRTKIEEVLYETLTQQYELAKVEEAKETPSVKVLDDASIPQRKSFPPRLAIMFLCGCFGLGAGGFVILARALWQQIDAGDPGKMLASEIAHSVDSKMPWATPNGSRIQAMTHHAWLRIFHSSRPDSHNN